MHAPAGGMVVWGAVLAAAASGASAFAPTTGLGSMQVRRPAGPAVARRVRPAGTSGLSMVQTPPRQSVSIKELSKQMQTARMDMEQGEVDERVRVLMEGMRGKSLNDDDFAADGTKMNVIEFDSKNDLPLDYDPDALKDYYKARPLLWLRRLAQVAGAGSKFVIPTLIDAATGQLEKNDVQRTRALREVLTSLGPFFIKLGQALAIRPDILSPSAMYELQRLCDKVPAFDNDLARKTVEDELGTSIESVFSEFSPRPIAAASLGQVRPSHGIFSFFRGHLFFASGARSRYFLYSTVT
jgi:aarF domain-containing kinase